jgi:diguanylate cyclase (GGDEF)-like protein/PAS domain S-box-containing protein
VVFDVADHVPSALAFVSADDALNFLYVNRAFTQLFGYVGDDVRSISGWSNLVHLDPALRRQRLSSWLTEVEIAKQENCPVPQRESHIHCQDGGYRDVIIQTSLMRDMILLAFTDITERKHLETEIHDREKRFRGFVENVNDIIYTLDLQGCFTYASPNIETTLGLNPAELQGTDFRPLIHPQDLAHCLSALASVTIHGQRLTGIEYRIRKGDGTWSWQASNVGPIHDDDGRIAALIGVGRDIQQSKAIEEQLYVSEARYRLLSDTVHDVIWTIAPDGIITYVSPSVELVRGYTPEEAMRQPLDQILTPDSIALNLAYVDELVTDVAAGRRPKSFRGEMEYLCKDGSTQWCDVVTTPILAEDGSLVELLGVSRDISEHKRHEAELKQAKDAAEALNQALEEANELLRKMATTDELTGLWNRRYFEDRVSQEILVADRYDLPLSVLIFDIDHFKRVNDTCGHLAGDHVLVELSARARQHVRATDVACRWGGEEFMILMPNTNAEGAVVVAEKLRSAFAVDPVEGVGVVTASFGVATYQPPESLDHWISRGDRALYEAKESGRNAVKFDPVG